MAASLWGGAKYTDSSGEQQVWRVVPESWGANGIGTVAFGTLAGAGGAALAKGNIWAGAATGFAVSFFNHVGHSTEEEGITQTKASSETSVSEETPFVLNESKKTIHYKPESTSEAKPLGPGEKTYDLVDGINVKGKVYKVTDGYTSVTVKANFKVVMDYSKSNIIQTVYALFKAGKVTRTDFKIDDYGWDNLFNIKN